MAGKEIVPTIVRQFRECNAEVEFSLRERKRVGLHEASGQDFAMYDRAYAPGFYDLIFGMLRDAGFIPNIRHTAGDDPR